MTESELPVESLRRLARGLLFDPHRAEDVVQEAWLAALQQKSAPAGLGAWLAGSVRRLAPNLLRSEARRSRRERAAARPEAVPGPDELSGQLEVLRRLLDAVDRLEEPYRTTIGLRYFEELPPRAIAARLGLPVETVRTRTKRALERLRHALDGDGRRREERLGALLAFAGPRGLPLVPAGAAPALATLGFLAVAAAVVVLVRQGALPGKPGHRLEETVSAALPAAGPEVETSGGGAALATSPPQGRVAVQATWTVRGLALGASGAFPELALVGRVFAGPDSEDGGEAGGAPPLLEERFESDASGAFAWELTAPTSLVTLTVTPEIAGHELYPAEWFLVPGDPEPELTVRARPLDASVRGVVRDAQGQPLSGARVSAGGQANHPDGRRSRTVLASVSGEYELALASTAGLPLYVEAEGCVPAQIRLGEVRAGEALVRDVTLDAEVRVAGRVVDEQGQPIAGAWILGTRRVTSAADGRFELGLAPGEPGERWSVWAGAEGFARQLVWRADVPAELEIRLLRGTRLAGRVRGPDGEPVPWTWISLEFPLRAAPEFRNEAWTDAEGRFELSEPLTRDAGEGIWMGEKQLWLWRAGLAHRRIEVRLPGDGRARHEIELALEAQHFLGGVLLDADGQPLAGRRVFSEDPDQIRPAFEGLMDRTDGAGRFRIEGFPSGRTVELSASAPGHARLAERCTELDRDDLVLRLAREERHAGFAGTVVDAETGAPLPRFTVRVLRGWAPIAPERRLLDFPPRWSEGQPVDDADGVFTLAADLEPGRRAGLRIEAPGYAHGFVPAAETALEPDPAALVVALERAGGVRGLVLDASGSPVAGARVRRHTLAEPLGLDAWEFLDPLQTTTDADGRFDLANVPPGETWLALGAPGFPDVVDGPFTVLAGGTSEREVALGGGARVAGRLLDADGQGLAGETIGVYGTRWLGLRFDATTSTAADGSFAFEDLPEGSLFVGWKRAELGYPRYDLVRRVEPRRAEIVALELRPGGATLRITLTAPAPLPSTVLVTLSPLPADGAERDPFQPCDGQRSLVARAGTGSLTGVAPGRYVLAAQAALDGFGEGYGRRTVEVPATGVLALELELGPMP
jgi:RNA polymerase sigma factor (sigma-70 family)